MSSSRYKVHNASEVHFLTCTVVRWIPLFMRPEIVDIVLETFRFMRAHERLYVHAYVVMENHLHLIGRAPDLRHEMRCFKSYTARQIVEYLRDLSDGWTLERLHRAKRRTRSRSDFQVWEEGNHPQEVTGGEMLLQKLEYIHSNPVRRGYVDEPAHWRYSSARDYAGIPGLIPVDLLTF